MPHPNAPPVDGPEGEIPSPPPTKKIFYGWWIVVGGMVVLMLSGGLGFFGLALILDPLRAQFGWSKGSISSAVTIFLMTAALVGPVIGEQVDRHGPSRVLLFGSLATGLGFILLSRIGELWQLYAVFLLIGIGWSCTSVIPVSTMVANWFIRRRGVAMSIAMTGMSIGGLVVVPLAGQAIQHWGLKIALPLLGMAFWVVVAPIGLFVVKQRPSVMGLLPDGDPPRSAPKVLPQNPPYDDSQMQVWTRREAMGTRTFWAVVVAFLLVLAGQAAFLLHEISFMGQFVGPTRAAVAVSVTSGASILGRLVMGTIVDLLDKRYAAMICFLLQGAAMLTAGFTSQVFLLYLCVFAFGLTIGNVIMLQSLIIGECFGRVSFGTVSGLAGLFITSVTSFGPMVAGFVYDATLSYRAAFCIFAGMSVCACLFLMHAKPPKRDV